MTQQPFATLPNLEILPVEPGEPDVYLMTFDGVIGSPEFHEQIETAYAIRQHQGNAFHVIFDMRRARGYTLDTLTKIRPTVLSSNTPPKMGLVVLVTQSAFAHTLIQLFIRLYPGAANRYRGAHSIEEARDILRREAHSAEGPLL